jgi:putative glutathione S-transferase
MTVTAQTGGASPVDFATYGDYGDHQSKRAQPAAKAGEFVRAAYPFRGRITADGSSGYLAEPGRYHLYISWACPWAHRSAIVRKLLGLEEVITLSAVDPVRDGRGWAFRAGDGYSLDPVNGFAFIRDAYEATEPGYDGHISVPVLWDRQTRAIVSNNFPDITIDLAPSSARGPTRLTTCTPSGCGRRSTQSTTRSTPP